MLLPASRLDAEPLGQDGDQDLDFHVTKSRQLLDPGGQVVAVTGALPYRAGVASVVLDDHLAQRLDSSGHAAREPVKSGPLPEYAVQLVRVHGRDLPHVKVAEPSLQIVGTGERFFHLDLLIEHQADQQGEQISLEELVGGRVIGPGDRHDVTLAHRGEYPVPLYPTCRRCLMWGGRKHIRRARGRTSIASTAA